MLGKSKGFSGFSVDDPEKAKKFYGEILRLKVKEEEMEGLFSLEISGGNTVLVYPKENHEPATFTILNFPVSDVEKKIDEMVLKGIQFEHYGTKEITTDSKGIFRGGGSLIAWFKDPAGNILSIIEE